MIRSTLEATLADRDGMRIESRTASGHLVVSDADQPTGGDGGSRPTELVLAALASCTGMDVISILRKKRQQPERYSLHLSAEADDHPPRVFRRIVVEHRVDGEVEEEALRRAVELSATRYCPVSRMLSAAVALEHRYRLLAAGQPRREGVAARSRPSSG